jgi:hypothetical protein
MYGRGQVSCHCCSVQSSIATLDALEIITVFLSDMPCVAAHEGTHPEESNQFDLVSGFKPMQLLHASLTRFLPGLTHVGAPVDGRTLLWVYVSVIQFPACTNYL